MSQRSISLWHYRAVPLILFLFILPGMNVFVSQPPTVVDTSDELIILNQSSSSSSSSSWSPPDSSEEYNKKWTTIMTNNSFHGVNARAFEKWKGPQVPCFPPTSSHENHRERGLLYLKLHKVGSSTAAGINARIARNEAQRRRRELLQVNTTIITTSAATGAEEVSFEGSCDAQLAHALARKMCPRRDKNKSFLWSIVRDPTSRVVSRFFHSHVSLAKKEPQDDAAIRFFCQQQQGDHYMSRLSTVPMTMTTSSTTGKSGNKNNQRMSEQDRVKYANLIMKEYDFIGVTERMDESAVALSMLLDIPLSDVLYLDGKVTGGYGLENCIYFVPSFQSPAVDEYFQTLEFQECTKWDRILHQVANRSLDLTIDETLGRAKFEAKLVKFRSALVFANEYCDDSKVIFSCTSSGVNNYKKRNDCLYKDSGCGYRCLDEVATKLNLD